MLYPERPGVSVYIAYRTLQMYIGYVLLQDVSDSDFTTPDIQKCILDITTVLLLCLKEHSTLLFSDD